MSSNHDAPAEQMIIIRRRSGEDDHHHGGVWKIAYADFMTAMMAFFLVMWLINAANTETKASVASYFNPIKLTDNVARKKGLLDIDEKYNAINHAKQDKSSEVDKKADKEKDKASQEKKKQNAGPAAPADGAAAKAAERKAKTSEQLPSAARPGAGGEAASHDAVEAGRSFRDPFSPFSSARTPGSDEGPKPDVASPQTASPDASPKLATGEPTEKLAAEAKNFLQDTQRVIEGIGITGGPSLDVTIEGDNIVLSLTDTSTFGMFAVGSAEPNALLVKLMQSITPLLSTHADRVIIRGHTDSRPFRSAATNNNWRLALARAEAAYAMLLRAGIEEARFERIEGHADRKPKNSADPEAAANRRIEIIMRRSLR